MVIRFASAPSTPRSASAVSPDHLASSFSAPTPVSLSASSRAFGLSGKISRIEAELNLELQSARDLHSIIKHSGGLNFSVGFRLEDFDVVEEKKLKPREPWLIVKRGDLTEVSIVTFPACSQAQMDLALSRSALPSFDALLVQSRRARAAAEELRLSWRRESMHDALMAQLRRTRAAVDNLRRAANG